MFLHVLQGILISVNQYKFVVVEHNMATHVEVLCCVVHRRFVSVSLGLGNASSLKELASNDAYRRGEGGEGRGGEGRGG